MELSDFAQEILSGPNLADKLIESDCFSDNNKFGNYKIPSFPERSKQIDPRNKKIALQKFPSSNHLQNDRMRGIVLHFFANHELLALELMALALLKFPDAPASFRRGIGETMKEEQAHLKLYMKRMEQLGVEFGDIRMNSFFWNRISTMKSPLEYTVLMSMTFEQANLDFAKYFQEIFRQVGDTETADLLEKVFLDEISHVKHGLHWFNRWRNSAREPLSEWQLYLKKIQKFMSAMHAKGPKYSISARRQVGFSQDFIDHLEIFNKSKSRPPSIWIFNPTFEQELLDPTSKGEQFIGGVIEEDLAIVLSLLCKEQDILLLKKKISIKHQQNLKNIGFKLPELLIVDKHQDILSRVETVSGIKPWAWSPSLFGQFKAKAKQFSEDSWEKKWLREGTYADIGIRKINSKIWSQDLLREYLYANRSDGDLWFGKAPLAGITCHSVHQSLSTIENFEAQQIPNLLIKGPWGTSGRNQFLYKKDNMSGKLLEKRIKNMLKMARSILIEPYLNKLCDFSIQAEVSASQKKYKILGITRFFTDKQRQYQGHKLNKIYSDLPETVRESILRERDHKVSLIKKIYHAADFVLKKIIAENYSGPVGIDSLIFHDENKNIFAKPIVEINGRYTMGHCALALERKLHPQSEGLWLTNSLDKKRHEPLPIKARFKDLKNGIGRKNEIISGH